MSVFRKETSRKGNIVYQEVLQKNFQIIQTFLKKFHQIFLKQDQFEQQLVKFNERFAQQDEHFEEFRQQQKISIVMLQKKVNNMKSTGRDSHRLSKRFNQMNFPNLEGLESEANKNFTLLKFDSIESSQDYIDSKRGHKRQAQQPVFSMKQYEEVKSSIESVREDIVEMKDKISFLSAYTSSLENREKNKSKNDALKKEITESLENDIKAMVEKQINTRMIETQKIFLQQIKNLAVQFTDEITFTLDKKFQVMQQDLENIRQSVFTQEQGEKLNDQVKQEMKKFATECMQTFPQKQDTKKSLNFLERKLKMLETGHRQLAAKTDDDKEQNEVFKNVFNVTPVSGSQSSKQMSLHKASKSISQLIKQKNQSVSLGGRQTLKENTGRNTNRKGYDLSQGVLFTSKVSKQFMKNFGKNQRRLIKGNFHEKRDSNSQLEPMLIEENNIRPFTALRDSMESF